jgi:hypothetical protein
MFKKLVLLVIAVAISAPASATSYYLSPLGSDTANGRSPTSAWQTIGKVNTSNFGPGDSLWIDGGNGAFGGCLAFASTRVTSIAANPFVVGVYNGAKWTLNSTCGIDGSASAAVSINGVSGLTLQDGVISGNGTHTLYGIWIRNTTLPGPADSVIVQRMEVSDFNTTKTTTYAAAIHIVGDPGKGLTNVQILNNKIHGLSVTALDDNGIAGYGSQNISAKYIGNEIYNMGGQTGRPQGFTGNGIWCNGTMSCEVAGNYIHDVAANVNQCGGPVGIGTWNANNSYIHDNEVSHVHATTWNSNTCDFMALDADGLSTNGLWERNYTHNNDGPAIAMYTAGLAWSPNQFRLNISEEDNLQNTNGGGIWALFPTKGAYLYNNTAYKSINRTTTTTFCISLGYNGAYSGGVIANNTCTNLSVDRFGRSGGLTDTSGSSTLNQASLTVSNNNYKLGTNPEFTWLGKVYLSLLSFQTATGKDANSTSVDPALALPGQGGICSGITNATCPSAYALAAGSSVEGKGADLSYFGIALPTVGYFGAAFRNAKGYNVGADSRIP